jgi:cell division septation protein DedD
MNSLLDDENEDPERTERELTLNTGTILGIFFGLMLLCGLFFGFGYKMGSHKPMEPVQAATAENSAAPATDFESFKPAAGSPAGGSSATATESASGSIKGGKPSAAAREEAAAARSAAAAEAPVAAAPAAVTGAGFVVQVAAVSHQEDAELLVNALRTKGYPVSAHTEPQDKFFHIQVGPYATHKDADMAKQKLVADGYQPIVK